MRRARRSLIPTKRTLGMWSWPARFGPGLGNCDLVPKSHGRRCGVHRSGGILHINPEIRDPQFGFPTPVCYNEVMEMHEAKFGLEDRIRGVLATIDGPEMPISIVDLGIVERIEVDGGSARIFITPTFTGCPALQMIDELIIERVGAMPEIHNVRIKHIFDPPWRADRISPAGRERLRAHGVTVPNGVFVQLRLAGAEAVHCPYCDSPNTRMESPFGPTRCRMIYYCRSCHNTFEHIKPV